ncbi:DNA primase [Paenibacillus radicis (ex Xue et al. 2023)]|uniref:DNA primase n=1 Tax=Paenibacillus radicis (ex Xue et al. 2023) TaxID=2972489 RepID=A0ABT1YDZ5_9BACL|nr:DNA primase [Paenibacillus radicis (ex Xue et al. 2023)]MCR8631413.1 DNA primase [Paenibacillus radicis (ex Xue et al. 2023)]
MSNGRIPEEIIEAVLKHHDIVDVVGRYVHLSKQGHYMKGLCPFHSEKSPSFTVTPEKQIYHCFGCGAGGGVIQFIMAMEGYSFAEAISQMAQEANLDIGIDPAADSRSQQNPDKTKLYEAYELTGKLYQYILKNTEQGKQAMQYLRSRGLNDKLIETFGIGYAPAPWDTLTQLLERRQFPLPLMERGGLLSVRQDGQGYFDKFRDRIIFPIHDWKGRLIAFGGRAMGDAQPKYLNSPESMLFHKSRSLYNIHLARPQIRKKQQIVLFEGYMDVIKAWETGVINGVATMGTALTEEHAEVIRKQADQVIVAYDGDSAGQNAAYKSIPILEKAGCLVKIALLPNSQDPDEYITTNGSERFVRDVIEAAVPSIKYKLIHFRKNFKLQEDGDKLRYIQQALKVIADIPSPVEREHYVRELSTEFRLTFEAALQDLNEIRLQSEKNNKFGDNKDKAWNNVMNDGRPRERAPSLLKAYHNAERQLLAIMMFDRDTTKYVERQLGDQFNVDAHAALAAYLYAYFAQGYEPNASSFIAMLQEKELEGLASSIAMMGNSHGVNGQVIDDYIREIKKYPQQQLIELKREEMLKAASLGDLTLAGQIGNEIMSLEKQLKSS